MNPPIFPPTYDEQMKETVSNIVSLVAKRSKGFWEVKLVPEIMAISISYTRKLKFAPFTVYHVSKALTYDPKFTSKNISIEAESIAEQMKEELNDYILNQLTE